MDCKEARKNIHLYLDNELAAEKLEPFIRHIHSCSECYEELEISYIMLEGMRRLEDGENIAVNFQQELAQKMKRQLQKCTRKRRIRLNLVLIGVVVSLFGMILGYIEQDYHSQDVMERQLKERGDKYYYHGTKKYIYEDGGYRPVSIREILNYDK